MLGDKTHRSLYLFALCLLAIGLPTSKFLISVSQIILAANFLLEGNYREKISRFWQSKIGPVFCSIYLLHIIGLLYTIDFQYGLHDLRIKLPILVFPIVIGGSAAISKKWFERILLLFVGSVLVSTFLSFLVYLGLFFEVKDYRNISLFMSHIRFGLMVALSILILIYLISTQGSNWKKRVGLVVVGWLLIFMFILKAMSGVAALLVAGVIAAVFLLFKSKQKIVGTAVLSFFFFAIFILAGTVYFEYNRFYQAYQIDLNMLDQYTVNGEPYQHDKENKQIENGYYLNIYIAPKELSKAWNKRSEFNFSENNKNGFKIQWTLYRFLTSKGYRKDSLGLEQLSNAEIHAIERGIANYRYIDGRSFSDRIYEIIWEIHNYSLGLNPQGHSVAQRLEFWKVGTEILKRNWLLGVGTGDVKKAFKEEHRKRGKFSKKYWLRAHNQYLTICVTFGLLGFIWFSLAFFYPLILRNTYSNYYFLIFIIIASISMLSEDTLETQAGVTFVAFFYCFFLLAQQPIIANEGATDL